MTAVLAFVLSHWRLLVAAGLAAALLFQHLEIQHYKQVITETADAQLKEVNKALVQNSVTEDKWHKAMTVGLINYKDANDKTRSTYERQMAQLRNSADGRMGNSPGAGPSGPVPAPGVQPSTNEGSTVSPDTATADSTACSDKLAGVYSAVDRCIESARAADECQATVRLLLDSWPR